MRFWISWGLQIEKKREDRQYRERDREREGESQLDGSPHSQ